MSKKTKPKKKTPPPTRESRARAQAKHLRRMKPDVPVSIRVKPVSTTAGLMHVAFFHNLLEHRSNADEFGEIKTCVRYYRLLGGLMLLEQSLPRDELRLVGDLVVATDAALERIEGRFAATGKLGVSAEDREALLDFIQLTGQMDLAATRRQADAILRHIVYGDDLPYTKRTPGGIELTRDANGLELRQPGAKAATGG